MRGHFHWFCYLAPKFQRREQDLHMVRDAAAFAELAAALNAFGYVYGEMMFNFPSPAPAQRAMGVSLFEEPAMIVLSTRPH
jgi:hypothetical protein